MGLFDSLGDFASGVGNFLSNHGSQIATAALIGGGIYTTLRAQQARERQLKEYDKANQAAAAGFVPPSAAVIPALTPAAAKKAAALYKQYYKQAQDLYSPWVDTGKRILPIQEGLYNQGASGLSDIAKAFLTPENISRAQIPVDNAKLNLPSYLRGGA